MKTPRTSPHATAADLSGRLSRHTLLLLASNAGGAVLLFALSVLIGRTLGRDGLGVYSVALAWVFPLSMLVDFGLSTLATRAVAQRPDDADGQLAQMATARLLIGVPAALLLALAAPLLSDDAAVIDGLRVSAPLVAILPAYSSLTAVFKGLGAMWPIPLLNVGMLLAQVGLSALVLAQGGGVVGLLVVNTVTSLAQLAAAWVLWRRMFRPRTVTSGVRFRWAALRDLLRQAWPFALAAVFAALQVRVSVIVLERAADVDQAAYFAAASRFTEAARLLPNAFFGALFPALSALAVNPPQLRQVFRRAAGWLSLFGVAVVVGAWQLGEPVLRLTYGDDFAPAAIALRLLAVALTLSLLRGAVTLLMYAKGREQRVNFINGLALAVQIGASFWLVENGATGVALAVCLAEGFALGSLWATYRNWRSV